MKLTRQYNFYSYFSKLKEVKRFQFIENQSDLELRIQIDNDVSDSSLLEHIGDEMMLRFGKKVKILITDQFVQNNDGKFLAVVKI